MTDLPSSVGSLVGTGVDHASLGRKILEATCGRVQFVAGIGSAGARACLDSLVVGEDNRLALLLPVERYAPADALIEDLARRLARVAKRCWPVWYGHVDFSGLKRDALGRDAVRLKLAAAAAVWPRLSLEWARAAVALAQDHKLPRPARAHWSSEIIQLCLAIHPNGLVIVFDAGVLPRPDMAHALVRALELVAEKAGVAVVVLCEALPDDGPPYDRIMADAVTLSSLRSPRNLPVLADAEDAEVSTTDLAPISGRPHPLSAIEQRVARALAAAPDLAPLFSCNEVVETVCGSCSKVDLLWREGRLVVELDSWRDHSRHDSFVGDRHRDYELALSGYTVLRLADVEIHQDVEKAIGKIRDVVTYMSTHRRST
jgi:hypothetical protein